ncbi:hypothetical protein HPP92_025585 [Vanilla planifolia]|uniref:Exportin-4 n=1 Tax=Vanilla planifolia TaxID=51239 RepID=A0A835UB66_VANPL|nr:hypothetical protein HPP92_025585 [Vanilla planifolia]
MWNICHWNIVLGLEEFIQYNGHTQINHLLQILSSILQWVEPGVVTEAIRCGRSESEFIDGCHALLSIATLATPTLFDSLVHSLRSFGTIHFMYLLTSDVVKANIADHDEEETWMTEAFDILLETWTVVFGSSNGDESSVSAEGKSAAAKLFTCLVEFLRKVAAETAYGEDDHAEYLLAAVSKRDERLESYVIIGRAAADVTIPYLFSVFSQCTSHLNQIIGKSDPTCILEELYWILLMIGHVLTDSGEGETIIIPEALQVEFSDFLEEAQHPVVLLSWSIIDFASQSLDPERRAACFSPRLMESIIWFLARWVETYLMPADSSKESTTPKDEVVNLNGSQSSKRILLNFAGEHKQGDVVLDIVTRICIAVLNSYPGENELQALTCQKLLVALVRRRNVCVRLLAMNSWQDLARAFSKERILLTLGSRLQRDLAKVFVSAASSLNDPQASNQYVMDLIESTTLYLMEISARNDLNDVAQLPDTMYMIICLLERLIGMAKATQPRTQKAIFDVGATVMKSLITLLKAYNNQPAVVYLIIRFVVDLVDGQIAYLDAKDTSLLVTFCLQLLQIYSSQNIRKMSLSHSSGLHCAAQDEKYKDLRALLQLLTNLCSKELIDFSPDEDGSPGIPEVIFFGLHIVSAMISLELLQYPKLSHCLQLLTLVSNTRMLTRSICVLRAINALASYHFREQAVGRGGLPTHMVDSSCPDWRIQENICSHFLRLLVQLVLYEDFRMDLAGSAADALLPLLLCNQNTYQSLVQEFLDKLPLPSLRPRLAAAFHSLTSSNKLSTSLDRPNLIRFRKNFREFLTEISGLRIK